MMELIRVINENLTRVCYDTLREIKHKSLDDFLFNNRADVSEL